MKKCGTECHKNVCAQLKPFRRQAVWKKTSEEFLQRSIALGWAECKLNAIDPELLEEAL